MAFNTPSPGREWTVTQSAQSPILYSPLEYCRDTVLPISANFLSSRIKKPNWSASCFSCVTNDSEKSSIMSTWVFTRQMCSPTLVKRSSILAVDVRSTDKHRFDFFVAMMLKSFLAMGLLASFSRFSYVNLVLSTGASATVGSLTAWLFFKYSLTFAAVSFVTLPCFTNISNSEEIVNRDFTCTLFASKFLTPPCCLSTMTTASSATSPSLRISFTVSRTLPPDVTTSSTISTV
ncbi:unnamed protein product [Plutella xylostella]|uniref:(diamondback moth) hypothetical protein n=1 Tax=Plutella xylostella TaxID=51655 RepID=A0A8S4D625_PLUXY|nr:unnamed protein product [Plutella xylostella]